MIKTLLLIPLLALQFQSVDNAVQQGKDYPACEQTLLEMLPQAENAKEKASVLWRLARVSYLIGEDQTDKMARREQFNKGIAYAERGCRENPRDPQCLMWHCANVGRECQTHPLMEQASAVPVMTQDLTRILNQLDPHMSEAWQALSEIYYYHPLKSKESGINYARAAALNAPKDEPRLITYIYLASRLYERNMSAGKRASLAADHSAKLAKLAGGSNIDRYALADGMKLTLPWTDKALGELSDREEARLILAYAESRYKTFGNPGKMERDEYKNLLKLKQQWK
jgi:hypothetical protein